MIRLLVSLGMASPLLGASAPPPFYGLTLVTNGPATFGLVQLDGATGAGKVVGPAHKELFGCSDLVAVAHGVLFYLGDTSAGATLVGLNLTDGTEVCSKPAAGLEEVGYVGVGQSLDFDPKTDTLVLSGLVNRTSAAGPSHAVFAAPATGCGPFVAGVTFGDSDFLPSLHSSSLDAEGQRLFVLLATAKSAPPAIGIVDLSGKAPMVVVAEGPAPADTLVSMHWDAKTKSLVGITASSDGLSLHSLQPAAGKWNAPVKISGVPASWNGLYGNAATVSTFDAAGRSVYFIAGVQDEQSGDIVSEFLAAVDVDDGTLQAHPKLAPVGLGGSGLQALAMAGSV